MVQRNPDGRHQAESELSVSQKQLDVSHKGGQNLLEVAKMYADYERRHEDLRK